MAPLATLAELRRVVAKAVPLRDEAELVFLAVCGQSNTRRALTSDADVREAFIRCELSGGSVDVEVRSLFPRPGEEPVVVTVPSRGWPDEPHKERLALRPPSKTEHHQELLRDLHRLPRHDHRQNDIEPSRLVLDHWPGSQFQPDGIYADSRAALPDRAIRVPHPLDVARVPISPQHHSPKRSSQLVEQSDLGLAGFKPSFGTPWPEDLEVRPNAEAGRQAAWQAQQPNENDAHLMEAIGMKSEYEQFCSELHNRRQGFEALLQQQSATDSSLEQLPWVGQNPEPYLGGSRSLRVYRRHMPEFSQNMHLLRQLDISTGEKLQERRVTATWHVDHAAQVLAERRRFGGRPVLMPRKVCWMSQYAPFGQSVTAACRLWPAGDGDSAPGCATAFLAISTPMALTFTFDFLVGESVAASRKQWAARRGWMRLEFQWELIAGALAMENKEHATMLLRLNLLEWHSSTEQDSSRPDSAQASPRKASAKENPQRIHGGSGSLRRREYLRTGLEVWNP